MLRFFGPTAQTSGLVVFYFRKWDIHIFLVCLMAISVLQTLTNVDSTSDLVPVIADLVPIVTAKALRLNEKLVVW